MTFAEERGTLQGKPFLANVVRFQGMWRVYLKTPMRQAAGFDVGDQVTIELQDDPVPRVVPARKEFTRALAKNKQAKEAFENLAPSRQKEILRYLNGLKQPATLARNIEKVLNLLDGKPVDGLVAVTQAKRRPRVGAN